MDQLLLPALLAADDVDVDADVLLRELEVGARAVDDHDMVVDELVVSSPKGVVVTVDISSLNVSWW